MATIRDYDDMLQCALEMKSKVQQFIDFAKMEGAGEGGEGEEDLMEAPYEDEETDGEGRMNETDLEDYAGPEKNKGKNLAVLIALKKKMKKDKK